MLWFAGVGTATDITSANPTPHFDEKNDSDFIFSYIKNKLTSRKIFNTLQIHQNVSK